MLCADQVAITQCVCAQEAIVYGKPMAGGLYRVVLLLAWGYCCLPTDHSRSSLVCDVMWELAQGKDLQRVRQDAGKFEAAWRRCQQQLESDQQRRCKVEADLQALRQQVHNQVNVCNRLQQ